MMVPVLQSFGTQIGQAVQTGLLSGAIGAQNAMTGVGQGLTTAGRSGGKGGMLASMAGGAFGGAMTPDMGSSAAGGGMANQSAGMMSHLPGGASFQSPAPAAPPAPLPTGGIYGLSQSPAGGLTPQTRGVAPQTGNRMSSPGGGGPFVPSFAPQGAQPYAPQGAQTLLGTPQGAHLQGFAPIGSGTMGGAPVEHLYSAPGTNVNTISGFDLWGSGGGVGGSAGAGALGGTISNTDI